MDNTWVRVIVVGVMYALGMFLVFRRAVSKERRRIQIVLAVLGGSVLALVAVSKLLAG